MAIKRRNLLLGSGGTLLLKLLMPLIVLPYGIVLSVLLGLVGKLIKTCILNGLL